MFQIDLMSRTPIYEQLKDQTEKMILAGILKPLDKMPSVRRLSLDLSVNPNTIQRAYTDMCNMGILVSMAGRGCYVTQNAPDIIRQDALRKLEGLDRIIGELKLAGVDLEKITEHINEIYKNT